MFCNYEDVLVMQYKNICRWANTLGLYEMLNNCIFSHLQVRPRKCLIKNICIFQQISFLVMGNATVGISFISVYEDVLVNLYKKYLRLSANIFYAKHSFTRIRVSVKIRSVAGFRPNTSSSMMSLTGSAPCCALSPPSVQSITPCRISSTISG